MDTNEIAAQLKSWVAREKDSLIAAGVTAVVGSYSGSGDEGSFNGTEAVKANGYPAEYLITDEINELFQNLEENLDAYGDGDGGGGDFTLDVEKGTLTHSSFYYETVQSDPEVEEL